MALEIPCGGVGGVEAGEAASGNLLPYGSPLRLEADTPGPERFLITAQEPNYLHHWAVGTGASSAPPKPDPEQRLWCLHLHLPTFTYSLSALTSNKPFTPCSSLPLPNVS